MSVFVREVIVNRKATARILRWLRFEPSARDLVLEMLSAPGCPHSARVEASLVLDMLRTSPASPTTTSTTTSTMLGVCTDLLERCPNLPADTLGSRLCFDLFEDAAWATGLTEAVFRGFSHPDDRADDAGTFLVSLVSQLDGGCVAEDSSGAVNPDGSDNNDARDGGNNGHHECLACESPIIAACLAKLDALTECLKIDGNAGPLLGLQALSLLESLLRLECKTCDAGILRAKVLDPVIESCCGGCATSRTGSNKNGTPSAAAMSQFGNAMWLAKVRQMLSFTLLDKDPEIGELYSYRRPSSTIALESDDLIATSVFQDHIRKHITVTLDLPGRIARALLQDKGNTLATAAERREWEGSMSRRERSRHDLFRAHLVNVANIVQHQEYHEQKKQRMHAKETWKNKNKNKNKKERRGSSNKNRKKGNTTNDAPPAAVGFGTGGAWSELVTIIPAPIGRGHHGNNTSGSSSSSSSPSGAQIVDVDLLAKINMRVFGRVTGAFQQLSDEWDESDDQSEDFFEEEFDNDDDDDDELFPGGEDGCLKRSNSRSPTKSPQRRKRSLSRSPTRSHPGSPKKRSEGSPTNSPGGSPTSSSRALLGGLGILPSTSSEKILAHDVVEQVMAKSLATMRQRTREAREKEMAEYVARQPALSQEAAADIHKARMQRAQNRFGFKRTESKENLGAAGEVEAGAAAAGGEGGAVASDRRSASPRLIASDALPALEPAASQTSTMSSPSLSLSESRRRRMKQRIAEAAAEDGDDSLSDSSSDGSGDDNDGGRLSRRRVMRRPYYEGKTGGSLSAASPATSSATRSLVGGVRLPSSRVDEDDDGDGGEDDDDRPEGKRGGSIGVQRAMMQGKMLLPSSLDDSDDSDDPEDERIRSYSNRRIPSTKSAAAPFAGGKTSSKK
jgi:hypothetical protein